MGGGRQVQAGAAAGAQFEDDDNQYGEQWLGWPLSACAACQRWDRTFAGHEARGQ